MSEPKLTETRGGAMSTYVRTRVLLIIHTYIHTPNPLNRPESAVSISPTEYYFLSGYAHRRDWGGSDG